MLDGNGHPRSSRSSSSDSDASEKVQNVRSVFIKYQQDDISKQSDENYSYKRRLGDLIFDANFECGNLGYVERVDMFNYDLMVRPDVSNPRHRLWFNFLVSNQSPDQCVLFNFVNLSEYVRLFHDSLTPVARNKTNPNWVRLHKDQVFYYRSPNHAYRYIYTIAFRFDSHDNEHQFALFYPHGFTTMSSFINRWHIETKRRQQNNDKRNSVSNFNTSSSTTSSPITVIGNSSSMRTRSALGITSMKKLHHIEQRCTSSMSHRNRNVPSIQSDMNNHKFSQSKIEIESLASSNLNKPIFKVTISDGSETLKSKAIILCRSGGNLDSCASIVCQGIIDSAMNDSLLASLSRQSIDYIIYPMLDPDSVWVGNSRTDIFGQAVRTDRVIRKNSHVYRGFLAVSEDIEQIIEQSYSSIGKQSITIIDLHVNIGLIGSRVIGSYFNEPLRMEQHLSFPRILAQFSKDFYMENCEFNPPETGSGSLLDFNEFGQVNQYRLEVSPFAYFKRSLAERSYEDLTPERYLTLGKAIIYTLFDLSHSLGNHQQGELFCLEQILRSFHHGPKDIDDLKLSTTDYD